MVYTFLYFYRIFKDQNFFRGFWRDYLGLYETVSPLSRIKESGCPAASEVMFDVGEVAERHSNQ